MNTRMNSRPRGLPADEYRRLNTQYILESHFDAEHGRKPRLHTAGPHTYADGAGFKLTQEEKLQRSKMSYETRKALGQSFDFTEESYQRLNGGQSSLYPPIHADHYGSRLEKVQAVRKTLALLPKNNFFGDSLRASYTRREDLLPTSSKSNNGEYSGMLFHANQYKDDYKHNSKYGSGYQRNSEYGSSDADSRHDSAYAFWVPDEPEPPSKFSWDSDSDYEVAPKKKKKKVRLRKYLKKKSTTS